MRRRDFLTALAGATPVLAGCMESQPRENNQDASPSPGNNTSTSPAAEEDDSSPSDTPQEPEPATFQIQDVTAPDSADRGEPVQVEVTVTNTGGETGVWNSTLYSKTTRGQMSEEWSSSEMQLRIPAGETRTWRSAELVLDRPAVAYYRVGEDGEVRGIDVPGSKAPIIRDVNLVSEWEAFGDALDKEINSADEGDVITIAFRYLYWAENQTLDVFHQVQVYDDDGERVAIETWEGEQVTDRNGWVIYENSVRFSTSEWGNGDFTADVQLRDNQNQGVSEEASTEFYLG